MKRVQQFRIQAGKLVVKRQVAIDLVKPVEPMEPWIVETFRLVEELGHEQTVSGTAVRVWIEPFRGAEQLTMEPPTNARVQE